MRPDLHEKSARENYLRLRIVKFNGLERLKTKLCSRKIGRQQNGEFRQR